MKCGIMSKVIKILYITITSISWVIFIVSLIRVIIIWDSLPDKIGVHFASNGEFDVFDNKNYIAYPYFIAVMNLVFCEILAILSKKIKLGMKISEKGDSQIRTAFQMLLAMLKLAFSFFFSGVWADCVIRQRPLNTNIPVAIMLIIFFTFFVFIIVSVVIKIKNPPESS